MKIKAVIFDIGGVLASINGPKRELGHHPVIMSNYIMKRLGIKRDLWVKIFKLTHVEASTGKLPKRDFLLRLAKGFGTSASEIEKLFIEGYRKAFRQNEELYKYAYALKKRGYKIAILSDQWKLSEECVMVPSKNRKFNVVVVSCDVGLKKPDPRIYRLTLRKLRVGADTAVFVDNRRENVAAAKKVGMKAILYKNNRQVIHGLKKLGVV